MNPKLVEDIPRITTALVSIRREDGTWDARAMANLASDIVENGSVNGDKPGILLFGSTGQGIQIPRDVRLEIVKTVAEYVGDNTVLIVNASSFSTEESVAIVQEMDELGDIVCGYLVSPPWYIIPPLEGLEDHFRDVASATDKFTILYEIDKRVSVSIPQEMVVRLADENDNIVAEKDASSDIDKRVPWIIKHAPDGFRVLAGNDNQHYDFLERGGYGGVLVRPNVPEIAKLEAKMVELFLAGKRDEAAHLAQRLEVFHNAHKGAGNPAGIDGALRICGRSMGKLVAPLLSVEELDKLRGTDMEGDIRRALEDLDIVCL